MTKNIVGFNEYNNNYSTPLKDKVNNYLLTSKEIHPAMVMDFIDNKINNKTQSGGDGYTIDVTKSINGMVGWNRYSFNYAPIIYGDLLPKPKGDTCNNLQNGGSGCGCDSNSDQAKSVYESMQSGGKKMKVNQFDAIQQVGKGLVPLGPNALINLILLIFLYHSVIDGNVDNKKVKKSIKKGGSSLISVIAPLGRGNLLILASLLLLHHFAVEKPAMKKVLKGGDGSIYSQLNKILQPLGLKNGVSPVLNELYDSFKMKKSNKNEQNGGSILKGIIAPLGTNAFIATGLLLVLKKILLDKTDSKVKKGGGKKEFNKLVNLLGPLSFNAFANENFVKEIFKINKNNKKENKENNKK
tara:strand:+ start:6584 stop:7648 length:1065 start_codon:yes stop_codon:yes gene_type:complete